MTSVWRQARAWLAMAMFATVILLLVSADSWTHGLYDHHDSATFFASGKAWMNGMVPYVDFSDSKGPLLWLIYGVGYLLSPHTVRGVFWLTCLCYAFIFWWLYKTAGIYLADRRKAMLASMVTALSIFFPVVRYETRAEDFALFFLVWGLYHVCRLLHDTACDRPQQTRRAAIVLGIGMAATLLIKYNVAAVLGVMAMFVLHDAWRHHTGLWRTLGWMALSSALLLAPFVAYMLAVGCLDDFLNEYFLVNMQVVARQHAAMRHPIFLLIGHRYTVGLYLLVGAVSALVVAWYARQYRAFVAVIFAATLALTVSNAFWLYYYAICGCFLCFGIVALFKVLAVQFSRWQVAANAAAVVLVVLGMHLASDESWWFRHGTESQVYDRYVSVMSRVKQPTLIYYNTCTYGYGVPVGSLPGCKYWTSQSGATPAMVDDQLQAIKNRRADFVLSLRLVDKPQMFDSLGYYRYDPDTASAIILYARNPITEAL